ncbi:Uncharacterized protein family (UPF0164) [Parelusimicrobium proximum]|uniref:UPF0164 family protein n=1 Tax=Parelusimicrobium proximum TaxID=3228953 RepID=UPI003D165E2B
MNNKCLKLIFACVMLGSALTASAAAYKDAGTSASAFLKIGSGSPRAQALGNAYVSLADGADALYWNPAGAAVLTSKEVQVAYLDWLQGYKARTLVFIQPLGKTILGITGNYMDVKDFDFRDDQGVGQPSTSGDVRNFVGSISLARGFFDNVIQIGGTAKYINENNDGDKYNNVAFDVGAKLDFGRIGLGAAMVNLGDKDEVPTGFRGGAHFNTRYWTLVGEAMKYTDYRWQVGAGLEIHIPEDILQVARFDLRVGYYTRENAGTSEEDWTEKVKLDRTSRVSFGFGLYSSEIFGYGASLDYAMTPFGALGTAQQISVGLQF